MTFNEKRKNLWAMMEDLVEAGYTIKDLYNTDSHDKTTTLFDSVQGLFDDEFEKEIKDEDAKENAYWERADEAYERLINAR